MTNLNSRSALHPRWTKAPLAVLSAFEAVVIAIFDPNNAETGPAAFDPWASRRSGDSFGFGDGPFGEDSFGGEGGGPAADGNVTMEPTLIWMGDAQMQVYRQALTVDDVAGSVTQLRSVRFTMDLEETNFPIRKGMIVRVISSTFPTTDTTYEYTVTSGANSALAFKRTIEAESDQSVAGPPISEFN